MSAAAVASHWTAAASSAPRGQSTAIKKGADDVSALAVASHWLTAANSAPRRQSMAVAGGEPAGERKLERKLERKRERERDRQRDREGEAAQAGMLNPRPETYNLNYKP